MAGEARQMVAGRMLDMKSSSGYVSTAYESEMACIIAAGTGGAADTEAWAGAARQAVGGESMAAAERAAAKEAESGMADASAALYDASTSTSAGQLAGAATLFIPGFAGAYMQAAALSGEAVECYRRRMDRYELVLPKALAAGRRPPVSRAGNAQHLFAIWVDGNR